MDVFTFLMGALTEQKFGSLMKSSALIVFIFLNRFIGLILYIRSLGPDGFSVIASRSFYL